MCSDPCTDKHQRNVLGAGCNQGSGPLTSQRSYTERSQNGSWGPLSSSRKNGKTEMNLSDCLPEEVELQEVEIDTTYGT